MKSEEGVRVIACFWRRVEPVLGGDKAGVVGAGGRGARRRYVINLSSALKIKDKHLTLISVDRFSRRSAKITIHAGYCNLSLQPHCKLKQRRAGAFLLTTGQILQKRELCLTVVTKVSERFMV